VYGIAFEAMVQSVALAQRVPRGYRSMADQLKRSSTGTVAAIAEGANRRTKAEKADKFGQARTEAGESAAWCEMLAGLSLLPPDDVLPVILLHERVVKMLSGLIRTHGGVP
jgi:four helix bundle protein